MSQSDKIAKFPIEIEKHTPLSEMVGAQEGLTAEVDPTREIRNLIDSLQAGVREAQARQRLAEEERDQLQEHVIRLQSEFALVEAAERKIAALQHERDGLAERQATYGEMVADLRIKQDVLEQQRRDALKHRDDANRLARDAQKTIEQAVASRDDAIKQLNAATRQRDFSNKERDEVARELNEVRALLAEAEKAVTDSKGNKKDTAAIEKQLASVRQARDSAAAQSVELKARVGELEDRVADLEYERDAVTVEKEKACADVAGLKARIEEMVVTHQKEAGLASELRAELDSLRKQHEELQGEREVQARTIARYSAELGELKDRNATLKKRNNGLASKAREVSDEAKELKVELEKRDGEVKDLRAQLHAADDAADAARRRVREREDEIQSLRDVAGAAQAELAARNEELASLNEKLAEAERDEIADPKSLKNHERTRLQMIELSAQLETAQHQIRELSASLAEARLQVRAGRAPVAKYVPASSLTNTDSAVARSMIATLRRCFERLSKSPSDVDLISDLQKNVRFFAEGAVVAGQRTVHRLSVSLGVLLKSLAETPEHAPAIIKTVGQTIEFLATLLNERDLDQRVKFEKARAFIVDDDQGICDFMADALKIAGVQSRSSLNAGAAIEELASSRYDLVLLDVFMPDLNGFDLCSHIRSMELHSTTPVMFVTGDASPENQAEAVQRGGVGLMAKPLLPEELALRALSSIARAQLGIA